MAFSLSGKTKDTFDSVEIAKKWRKILAITNYIHSPIGQTADLVLQTAIEEFLNGGIVSREKSSQLYICDLLVQGYEQKNNINAVELRERVLRSILDKSID